VRLIKCSKCDFTLGISTETEIRTPHVVERAFETEMIRDGERYGVIKLTCPECGRIKKLDARTRKLPK
jgi:hypothetical protein